MMHQIESGPVRVNLDRLGEVVNVDMLMAVYCQTHVTKIKPFDTFVAVADLNGDCPVHHPWYELVVKTVTADGVVSANMYRLVDGKRELEQVTEFDPDRLKTMIHMGLFVPQEFFLQFVERDNDAGGDVASGEAD